MDVPTFFAAIVALTIVIYVLADGFDLGVGILFLLAPSSADRDLMMASIEPVWDGNETWLVLGGTALWAIFPAAYYVLLPAFYLPIMLMLFALILRGIAFAFRLHSTRYRRVWDYAFAGGSLLAALAQGVVLGGFIEGVRMQGHAFVGGPFDCLSILGVLCGIGLVGGYALLGASWLIWKTGGTTQVFGRELAHAALILTAAMMLVVSAWTALSEPEVLERWSAWPNVLFLAPVPAVTALVVLATWRSLSATNETRPFRLSVVLFLLGFGGLCISLWPYVVPRQVTIWDGIADPQTLWFVGIGLVAVIPVVLAYQAYAYWVFRGKAEGSTEHGAGLPIKGRHTTADHTPLHLS